MPKEYQIRRRGKPVTYGVVDNGAALRLPRGANRPAAAQLEFKGEQSGIPALNSEEAWQVRKANWIPASLLAAESDLGEHERGVCVRDDHGCLCFVGETLNIKLSDKLDDGQCDVLLKRNGLSVIRQLWFGTNLFHVRPSDHRLAFDAIAAIASRDANEVKFAEPVVRHSRAMSRAAPFRPTDPGYPDQWQWQAVKAEAAWNFNRRTTGEGMRIAVVDRGFHWRLPDLRSQSLAISGVIDESTPFKQGLEDIPPYSHGTFAAAQAAGKADNAAAADRPHGCGMAPDAELLLVCTEDLGDVTQNEIARAIGFAAVPSNEIAGDPRGADVLTCAEGPPESIAWDLESVLEEALICAEKKGRRGKGMPVFWAVSNAGGQFSGAGAKEVDEVASHKFVIAVGSFNKGGKVSSFSSFGDRLAFVAPGERVYNINGVEGFVYEDGTSFAAPIAAGIGALVLQTNPKLSAAEVREIMSKSCDAVDAADKPKAGAGRINAHKAVETAKNWPIPSA